ncbi:hypothetical protein C7271_24135 [filamentous cyanobacterium CCP5]|nr:hypothetical protein C7271_24135 [filamentous cyanobacterium CCP5]
MSAPVGSPEFSQSTQSVAGTSGSEPAALSDRVCWVELKQYQYQPDHQVELLHLQAEADALLLQLQAIRQRRQGSSSLVP